jgi:hypothetical protein
MVAAMTGRIRDIGHLGAQVKAMHVQIGILSSAKAFKLEDRHAHGRIMIWPENTENAGSWWTDAITPIPNLR